MAVDLSNLALAGRDMLGRPFWPHFGELRRLCDPNGGGHALMVGSHAPGATPRWVDAAAKAGFVAASLPRTPYGEKGVDELLALWTLVALESSDGPGTLVLVAGDGDHASLVYAARGYGWRTEVWFFRPLTSHLLVSAADEFRDVSPNLEALRWRDIGNPARQPPAALLEIAGPRAVVGLPRPCWAVVA